MGKRKLRSEISKSLISCRGGCEEEDNIETVSGEEKVGFFGCYLLTSLSPRHKGHTYIGFTVNPRRRIRQHNGEMRSGAWRTKTKRPWEMVLCIYGFPTNVSALQFEWAWQHPTESLAVRKAAATFKSLSGLANKIKLAYTMLTLPAWQGLRLTVNFFSTKYTKHSAGCPTLPQHMRVQVCSMDDLPCYTGSDHNLCEDEDDCDDNDNDNEICNKTSSTHGSVNEGLTNIKVDSHRDLWKSIEETSHDQNGRIVDIVMRQSGDLLSSNEDRGRPLLFATSPVQVSSSFLTDTLIVFEAVEERDASSSVEFDEPASKELPTTIGAADTDQHPINSPIGPCEVEVIDLLSPSPGYGISSSRKKREVSNVCPEFIDLTKSPIFFSIKKKIIIIEIQMR